MHQSFLLIGHRASGKSTLGRRLADARGLPFIDLDEDIACSHGKSAADLVAEDEPAFREAEREQLRSILAHRTPSVIAVGGGFKVFPPGILTIWISRDGWDEDAIAQRQRLRPELPAEEEIAWMRETREERYRRAAHLRLQIERGCGIEEAAHRLVLLSEWLENAVGAPAMRRSWMLPRDEDDLARCIADVTLLAMAGVEIRSDRYADLPDLDVPWLASLRTEEDGFFRRARNAAAFDCDTGLLKHLDLSGLAPRPLILSTHPNDVYKEFFEHLIGLPAWIEKAWPEWRHLLMLKYAPRVKSWTELRYAYQLYKVYEKNGGRITFLPQGKPWRWVRAMRLVAGNECNYVSSGCCEESHLPPALDYFLPHVQEPAPTTFFGVVGNPVEQSFGDVFHRAMSLHADGGRDSYFKIPLTAAEIDNCLHLLPQFGFRGLSVTSPLKEAVTESNFVGCESDIPAGNTLAYVKGSFLLYDTDEAGMCAALEEIEARGIEPGPTLIFGSGGVTHALRRALQSRGWNPVHLVRARDGWGTHADSTVTLVIDASGGTADAAAHAPRARAWLDMRYRDVARAPDGVERVFSGMTFYTAQAMAQRRLWGCAEVRDHPFSHPESKA
ncbi:MAG: hypothetical protein JXA28_01165 [Bacteroidetes bacterium]|nr:hypothetical protein [Bacteroidota bacterium]